MTLLLLGGAGETWPLARALAAQGRDCILSLARDDARAFDAGLPVRVGGFDGAAGFRDFVATRGITGVLDVTHPFAARITGRTVRLCHELGVPYCRVERPPWTAEPGDLWTLLDREEDAADHITPGATVFLATGRDALARFEGLRSCRVICRVLAPTDETFPFANGEFLPGRAPFTVAQERALFRRLGVDWLVVRNAGGEGPRAKLIAAREEGIRVAMLSRPERPGGPYVQDIEAAMDWVASL